MFIVISDYEEVIAFFDTKEQADEFLVRINSNRVEIKEIYAPDLSKQIRFDIFYHYDSDTWSWDFFPLSSEIGEIKNYDYDQVEIIRNDEYFFGITLSAYDWEEALALAKNYKDKI